MNRKVGHSVPLRTPGFKSRTPFWSRFSGYAFVAPYLILFTAFLLIPLLFGLGLSFTNWEMISPAPPEFIKGANYVEALKDKYFWQALWATFRFVIMVVPLTAGFALLVAVGLSALPARRTNILRAAYFLPTIITISVAGILWRWFFNSEFGLFNHYLSSFGVRIPWITDKAWAMPSIVLMTLWWTVGGPMVILLAGIMQIPDHYHEAAAIDGANARQRFIHITLPLLKPVLLFVIIMNVIGAFQVFGQTFMVTSGGPERSTRVLVQYIYETAFTNYRMGYGAAMSWMLFLIIGVFSFLQYRTMREGGK